MLLEGPGRVKRDVREFPCVAALRRTHAFAIPRALLFLTMSAAGQRINFTGHRREIVFDAGILFYRITVSRADRPPAVGERTRRKNQHVKNRGREPAGRRGMNGERAR